MTASQPKRSKRYAELAYFASDEDATGAMRDWSRRLLKKPTFWLGLAGYTAATGGVIFCTLLLLKRWINIPPSMYGGLVGGLTGGSGFVVISWFWRKQATAHLRRLLRQRGIAICMKCGYDLRGQTEPRCPECGLHFDPALIKESGPPPQSNGNADGR